MVTQRSEKSLKMNRIESAGGADFLSQKTSRVRTYGGDGLSLRGRADPGMVTNTQGPFRIHHRTFPTICHFRSFSTVTGL